MKSCLLWACLALAGCAAYRPMNVPATDSLRREVRSLTVDVSSLPDARLRSHRFDPGDGFDITEIAMLAVANNPELKALRADAGVARAQAFSAGLLPDPQLALTTDRVMGQAPGSTFAYNGGVTFDVAAILARSSSHAAADADSHKADLDLLWQEWQTVAKARLLFVKIDAMTRTQGLLATEREALRTRLEAAQAAVAKGLISQEQAAPLLSACEDAARQWNDLERQRNQARHDLNALVGVAPEIELALVGDPDTPTLTADDVRDGLAQAPRTRPDLLALRAGLEAQDDKYRGAIQAQFPAITVGPTRARDTSNVNTWGLSLGIALPLFNRNRGNIAIESATRDKLLVDYQQRLDTDAIESHRLLAEEGILRRQSQEIEASLPLLQRVAERARQAYEARNLDAFGLTTAEGVLLARRIEQVNTQQALQEQAIALQALLGGRLDLPQS